MYTKQQFGYDLKKKIAARQSVSLIGAWSHNLYYEHISEIDAKSGFRKFLLQLGTMEIGPEFEFSYEELDKIADRLIAGEDVQL